MDADHNGSLSFAIDLWIDWMRADWLEVRELWFPKQTPGLVGGWTRGEHAFEDLESEVESRIIIIVNRAVGDMPPAMRAAFESSVGLLKVCRVRNPEDLAKDAKDRIWRALMSEGAL